MTGLLTLKGEVEVTKGQRISLRCVRLEPFPFLPCRALLRPSPVWLRVSCGWSSVVENLERAERRRRPATRCARGWSVLRRSPELSATPQLDPIAASVAAAIRRKFSETSGCSATAAQKRRAAAELRSQFSRKRGIGAGARTISVGTAPWRVGA